MNIINNDFFRKIIPYVAEKLRVDEDNIFIDFRSIFVGGLSSIGVLASEDDETIIKEDSYNSIAIYDDEIGEYVFSPNNGDYYYFLGYIGNDLSMIVDDTYNMDISNKNDNTGFFFEKLRITSDSLPAKIYVLRFRRTA